MDIKDTCLLITCHMVQKVVDIFSKDPKLDQREVIKDTLESIKFEMSNTLLTFKDEFYQYSGEHEPEDRRLTIGGFESAWLADLVAGYILFNKCNLFQDYFFDRIYRDD